jgi:xanthine dehydrogenase large subunit
MPAVGKDIPHDSAAGHVTGESVFLDDLPMARNELLVDFVGSPVAHGKLVSIDTSAVPTNVLVFTHRDLPGHNRFGPIIQDEKLLVDDVAEYVGDPVVLLAAATRAELAAAKKAVKVVIEPLPPIFSIEDAIAAKQFIGPERTIARGDVDAALAAAEHTLEGELNIGGQEHFYLESQVAICHPGEHGQMVVQSSTQHPSEVQSIVAEALGVPFHKVTVVCKRMGGGFGGKETQAALPAALAAVVAAKTRRPARFAYAKDDDMKFTGKRHPFLSRWRVGFDSAGRITALDVRLFSNGGCSCDLSPSILERAMLHTDNAYWLPNARIIGRVCKTNLPSNTAFRGFGGPQGVAGTENIIEEIAANLKIDAADVRRINCYGIDDRNTTPYGQIVKNNTLPALFDRARIECDYDNRMTAIRLANKTGRTHVRGMSMTAVKFGISFTKKTLNQANALVNIYTDGSVAVSTGATEMGQGVHTRVRQIVADELGVKYDRVIVAPTSTDKNHNTSPTAASSGTDLNGAAAADACVKIRNRLAGFAAPLLGNPESGLDKSPADVVFEDGMVFDRRDPSRTMRFEELICRAYLERINLGERGFYVTPGVDFNRDTGKGHPFLYFTNAVAVSEVQIDRFTGEMRVVRVDLLVDAGKCINPGIDRGQVTGGFVQGMGWVTAEELKYNDHGCLLSYSPTTYKIPNVGDLPDVFNVSFFENPDNTVSLRGSKALGEPPLLLGISVWTAVKHAVSFAAGKQKLSLPATAETILGAMCDGAAIDRVATAEPVEAGRVSQVVVDER